MPRAMLLEYPSNDLRVTCLQDDQVKHRHALFEQITDLLSVNEFAFACWCLEQEEILLELRVDLLILESHTRSFHHIL